MKRLREGFVETANPYNASQIKRVSLLPVTKGMKTENGVDVFVFWTRNPRHILAHADELINRGIPFYVMVSVTGYPNTLEPNMSPASEVLPVMRELARKIGEDRVIWRYDPILLSNVTDEDFHRRNFDSLAQGLAGSVRRVIISIYDEYKGAKQRLEELEEEGLFLLDTGGDLLPMLADLAKSAEAAGMEIQSCAEGEDYSPIGIKPGACVDAALIKKLCGLEFSGKDKNQRSYCLCCKSTDIGAYGTCDAKCVYCYAWR